MCNIVVETCVAISYLKSVIYYHMCIPDQPYKEYILCAESIILIQWVLAILLIVVLLKEKPHTRFENINVQYASDLITIILFGLTGPFVIFLLPFCFLKCFNDRSIYNSVFPSSAAVIFSSQLIFVISTSVQAQDVALHF